MATGGAIPGKSRRFVRPDLVVPLVLIGAGVLFFFDVLFSSKNFYFRDILNFHYPLRKVLIDSFARGELPLWNPYIYLGQPMLANPNYMAFYPTNLFHLFLPFNYAFKLHFIVHPILGGLGLYFLARRLGVVPLAACVGALAYEFSGTVLSFLNLYNIIPAVALLPWIGWAFRGALQARRVRRTLVFGLLLALQVIALEPLVFQCAAVLLAALAAAHIAERRPWLPAVRDSAAVLLGGCVFAAGLAAIQIIPTLQLLPFSARGRGVGFEFASGWSMHPMDLVNALVPNLYGAFYTIGDATSWGEMFHEQTTPYLVSFFLGTVTLLLTVLSFFSPRKGLQAILVACGALGTVLALGKYTPVYPFLYRSVPFFDLGRYPSKYFLLVTLVTSILAALGLERLIAAGTRDTRSAGVRPVCVLSAVIGAVILGLGFYGVRHPGLVEAALRACAGAAPAAPKDLLLIATRLAQSVMASGAFLLLSSLLAFLALRGGRFRQAGLLLGLLVPAELMPPNLGLSPLISDADVDYLPEINDIIAASGPQKPYRVATPNLVDSTPKELVLKAPNMSAAWRVLFYRRSGQSLDAIRSGIECSIDRSVDHLNTEESDRLAQECLKMPRDRRLRLLANLNTPLFLALGDLQYPVAVQLAAVETHSNLDYRLYGLREFSPRAYLATRTVLAESSERALALLLETESPLRDSVILETDRSAPAAPETAGGTVLIERYENNRVLCRTESTSGGYVVLLDSYYPGWRASVDGIEHPILRANYAFRAVRVPAGNHRVEFNFRPRSFVAGAAVSLATAFAGAGLACAVILRARRTRNHGGDHA